MRHLDWEGCCNVRDLGGLRTRSGGAIARGALIRADAPDRMTERGWAALRAHGVRTIVDLRNHDERTAAPLVDGLDLVHVALDGMEHRDFWDDWQYGPQFGTPLYYGPFLQRFPDRVASVMSAVARARPGGVLFHCGIGRDRTGLIAVLLLSLLGVPVEDIADDYALSAERVSRLSARTGRPDDGPIIDAFLSARGTSARALVVSLLEAIDVEAYLGGAGVTLEDLHAIRARSLDHEPRGD